MLLAIGAAMVAACGGTTSSNEDAGAACPPTQLLCGSTCVDPNTDPNYCGASGDCAGANAGTACEDGFACNGAGSCELSCQAGLTDCSGTCVDTNRDPSNCGGCDDGAGSNTCAAGFACNGAGSCELSCPTGLTDCSGTCVDTNVDSSNCGGCDDGAGSNTCAAGSVCNGAGSCEVSCGSNLALCGGACVDPDTDPANCGVDSSCGGGEVCAGSESCNQGVCEGGSCTAGTPSDLIMEAQVSGTTFVRGYWFTAQSDFVITGLRDPLTVGTQNLQVVRLAAAPPTYPTETTNFTTLAWVTGHAENSGFVTLCVPVFTGDVIGILGERNGFTSYPSAGNKTVTIDGFSTVLRRFMYQGNITNAPANSVTSIDGSSIGRVDMRYADF